MIKLESDRLSSEEPFFETQHKVSQFSSNNTIPASNQNIIQTTEKLSKRPFQEGEERQQR